MANTVSIGNCGEYFVAAELERNGFTAAVPMSNTKSFYVLYTAAIDIFVSAVRTFINDHRI